MNKICATGRLAADSEVRFTPKGDAIANFKLASDVGFGEKKTTNWFACAMFGKRGEALNPHLLKGTQVTVFGSLTLREWTNKDGAKQISPDIFVDEIVLQGGKKDDLQTPQRQQAAPRQARNAPQDTSDMDDQIPF